MSVSSEFDVRSSLGSYRVRVGSNICRAPDGQAPDDILVVDSLVLEHFPSLNRERKIVLEAVESAKSLDTVAHIIESLRDLGATRRSSLTVVGGGVVQDVATAAASLYMRGIPWTYCPTTLLAMADSCIGGKSSINVGRYKNLAGNFYPPREVVVDMAFVQSLPALQRIAGLCEAAKICYAHRSSAFDRYLAIWGHASPLGDAAALQAVISLSLTTKRTFIEEDEFDQGVRLLLNFGHTFGHALEAASDFAISHGVAVGLGMLAALDLAQEQGWSVSDCARAHALRQHVRLLLQHVDGLDRDLRCLQVQEVLRCFRADKKHRQSDYAVIVPTTDGFLERRFIPRNAQTDIELVRVFESLLGVMG